NIQAGRVGVVHDDATMFSIPSGPTIFFLYNPFSGVVLRRFIDHVLEDHARAPRPMVFFYLNPEETAVFDAEPTLIRSPVPESLVVRLSALSPYKLAIYETAPHDPDQRPA
ncbi:MAG: hypothetical protein ACR2O4_03035, partial [Hyphomicrobiaceae bacterium]